ncbi:MAG TPA: chemotaxis protein CheA [Kofleriaceae bacterium]|nr:chemotaxis protein CheA [Kofleriaceae bacterium]
MTPPSYLTTFVHEVEDLLERIEAAILALESTPGDAELVNQLFRAFHTLKGSAGVAGVTSISAFTHHVETAMDHVRSGALTLTPPLVSAVLASRDHVAALLAAALGGEPCDPRTGEALIAQLAELTSAIAPAPAAAPATPAPAAAAPALPEVLVDYYVTFQPSVGAAELAALEIDPDALIGELRALGALHVLAPPTLTPDETGALSAWQFLVTTGRDEDAIHDVFIFIAGAGELRIERGLSEFVPDAPELAGLPELDHAGPAASSGAPPAAQATSAAAAPARTTAPAARRRAPGASADSTVRVSSERLDHLVKLVGELVITQSRLQQAHSLHPSPELAGPVESLERLIADFRDGILGLRMVPIGTLFTRFQRLIRDLSGELDKEVELVTSGDETELDKTVIDQLSDAVVHILRNSMDHGFEEPDVRVAAGKPRKGTLRLGATHEGTNVVLTISDDGRGIDLAAVRRKAEAQGLIAPGEALSDQETIALVTRPGFSTAQTVTQVSGRGVGMDVVKRTVEGLRGSLAITSRSGQGTEIRLTLPLTLAIIDGLLVEIERDRFIVPMAAVTENLELSGDDRRAHNGRNVVALRGELVPYIRLRELFQIDDGGGSLEKVVVVSVEGQRVGLVVDRVIGSHQTVIQPLGRFYRSIGLFSGTTIMGDGRVAMILDLAGTVRAGNGDSLSSGTSVYS